jgi:uroporphyrinogen-III decarboxylase
MVRSAGHSITEQVFYILEGGAELRIGPETAEHFRVKPGDVVRIPPDTWHKIANDGSVPVRYVSVDGQKCGPFYVQLGDARRLAGKPDFTVARSAGHSINGGMDSPHLELGEDSEATLHAYTRDLFASMGNKRHFIFASSCMTSPLTPWENLVFLRDAAREYGRLA